MIQNTPPPISTCIQIQRSFRIYTLLALVSILVSANYVCQAQYFQQTFGHNEGLNQNGIRSIAKDSLGFIWVQTHMGYSRFDGYKFHNYTKYYHAHGIKSWNYEVPQDVGYHAYRRFHDLTYSSEIIEEQRFSTMNDDLALVLIFKPEHGTWEEVVDSLFDSSKKIKLTNRSDFDLKEHLKASTINNSRDVYSYHAGCCLLAINSLIFSQNIDSVSPKFEYLKIVDIVQDKEINFKRIQHIIEVDGRLWILADRKCYKTSLSSVFPPSTPYTIYVEEVKFNTADLKTDAGEIIFAMVKGPEGQIFIRTNKGIFRYYVENRNLELIIPEDLYRILEDSDHWKLETMYYDTDEIIWTGTDVGLGKTVVKEPNYKYLARFPYPYTRNDVRYFYQFLIDDERTLWLGTLLNGLYYSNPDSLLRYPDIQKFKPDYPDKHDLHISRITSIHEDSESNMWITTVPNSSFDQYEIHPGLHYSTTTKWNKKVNIVPFAHQAIEDRNTNLLLSGYYPKGTSCIYVRKKEKWFFHLKNKHEAFQTTYQRFNYGFNNRIIACNENEVRIISDEWHTDFFNLPYYSESDNYHKNRLDWHYAYPEKTDLFFRNDTIASDHAGFNIGAFLLKDLDDKSEIWFSQAKSEIIYRFELDSLGTLSSFNSRYIGQYSFINPLLHKNNDNEVIDIIEDGDGKVWIYTVYGINYIDPVSHEVLRYPLGKNIPMEYWTGSLKYDERDGMMYLLANRGLIQFDPGNIIYEPSPEVLITDFLLFKESVPVNEKSALKKDILETESIRLKSTQNFLSFKFLALDYIDNEFINYRYMLKGFDNDWHEADQLHSMDYANLHPGRYNFKVISTNSQGIWSEEGDSMKIHIRHPFWFRWWFFGMEGLIFIFIIVFIVRRRERYLHQRAATLEKNVKEKTQEILDQRKEVDEMKSRFYTNISHEFRTPLTLIQAPLDDIDKQEGNVLSIQRSTLGMIRSNAQRLKNLIGQLLDISRLESGKMKLVLIKGDLSEFISTISSSFNSAAESRNIRYTIEVEKRASIVYFDPDKIEKIVINLISNAFKFTPDEGNIDIQLKYEQTAKDGEEKAAIIVKDTGRGIEKEQLRNIFDRFYQVSDSDTRNAEGSGIGLALTKDLVELMHGEIVVESEPGIGSTFKVVIPVGKNYFSPEEISKALSDTTSKSKKVVQAVDSEPKQMMREFDSTEQVMLIVEDNAQLRKYISEKFSDEYQVISEENGKKGLETAIQTMPDIILTDLMMPVMGGMEMCEKLKEHPSTNHIPIIMITAKADKKSKLEGLNSCADDYIVKPFDSEELIVRVNNIVRKRIELRKHFQKELLFEDIKNGNATPQFSFLRKILEIYNNHLDDSEFKVDILCSELHLSRSQLFRKVNAVTGSSPNELLRMIRIKRAAQLLRAEEMNITQVMYQVGFGSPSHFANSFKKYYGVTPSEYRNNSKE